MRADAIKLVTMSADQALARIQFMRIAFGAAGSAGAQIDSGDAETISRGFLEDDKTKLVWNLPRAILPKNRIKLLLNMLLIAGQAIPRGGTITVDGIGSGETTGFSLRAAGTNAKVSAAVPLLVAGDGGAEGVDAHRIQPFYTGLLARACGASVNISPEPDAVVITAS